MAKKLSTYYINLVQDACLHAFWRKSALANFMRSCHISEEYIKGLFEGKSKAVVLSDIFGVLMRKSSPRYTDVLLLISKELVSMQSFPDLQGWEDSEQKILEAQKAVSKLREEYLKLEPVMVDTGDEEKRILAKQKRDASALYEQKFSGFADRLRDVACRVGQQQAGYDFEDWIYDFAKFNDIVVRRPYKDVNGRQIDGALTIDGITMLIEAKCTRDPITPDEIDSFYKKITTKAENTLGLMLSLSGYKDTAINEAAHGRTPFILIDGGHLFNLVMSRRISLEELINRVKRHAAQTGMPYLPVNEF